MRDEAEYALEQIAGLLGCDTGHVADTVRHRLAEAREQGRAEERSDVVAWLDKLAADTPMGCEEERYRVYEEISLYVEACEHIGLKPDSHERVK